MKQMQIMKEVAKAYRNIGDFYNALNLYYECLLLNSEQDWLHRVELLLKIGKVYRNYLMQTELARFYGRFTGMKKTLIKQKSFLKCQKDCMEKRVAGHRFMKY